MDFDHNKYSDINDSKRQYEDSCSKDKTDGPIATEEVKERACDSLIMCIVTTMNQGLRNGGGIGDILRAPSSGVSYFAFVFLHFYHFYNIFPGAIICSQGYIRSLVLLHRNNYST